MVAFDPHGIVISRIGIVLSSMVKTHPGAATLLKWSLVRRFEPRGRLPGLLSFIPLGKVWISFMRNGTLNSISGG